MLCHFLVIFYGENAAMPMEDQDCTTRFQSGLLHGFSTEKMKSDDDAWLCLFSPRENYSIWGVQGYTRENMK